MTAPAPLPALPPAPAELADLARILGPEALLRLIELHGGTRIHVPQTVNQGTKLAREIGLGPARALSAIYAREDLQVPLARPWRARIYRLRGDSYPMIARKLGLTESGVYRLLRGLRLTGAAAPTQLDLFGGPTEG